ncbi:LppM family (lipo)protein [Nocardia cyriacigeorgica]|uniref:LppM family (lipo)protein n=1 Tax=Nocardia cyriacigeorgica TaxID=135487 RepID=UPI003D7CDC0F
MSPVQPSPDTTTPDAPVTTPRSPRPGIRVTAAVLLAALLVPVLAGCLRVQASMGVSSNDRVSGRIVAAVIPANPEDKGPQLKAPDTLATKMRVEPYSQDGYVGSQVFFDDLNFGEVQQLGQLSDQTQGMFQLQFQRTGDLVALDGRVDLKSVPPHGSDVQFSVAFPARVAKTNGNREGDSVVTWKLPPGDVTRLHAEVSYADPNTRSFAGWAGIVGGITLAVAAVVAAMAYVNRNPAPPNAPAPNFDLGRWWREVRSGR